MPENNLHMTRTLLLDAFGDDQGYGPSYSDWSSNSVDVTRAQRIIDGGLQQFYGPPPLPGERAPHIWSFLNPTQPIGFSPNVASYVLPDDFGGFIAGQTHWYYRASDNTQLALTLVGIGMVRNERQRSGADVATIGAPQMAAWVSLPADGTDGQRFALEIWPTPDAEYTCDAEYYSNPYQLTASKPYPLGGQPHANTLRASVLAYAEVELKKSKGPRWEQFMQSLTTSVWHDRRLVTAAKNLGRNIDHGRGVVSTRRTQGLVTYQNSTYEG